MRERVGTGGPRAAGGHGKLEAMLTSMVAHGRLHHRWVLAFSVVGLHRHFEAADSLEIAGKTRLICVTFNAGPRSFVTLDRHAKGTAASCQRVGAWMRSTR